jgi:restriction endonuclease S subunit
MKTNLLQKNIPKEWQEKRLSEVCDIFNGSTPKRSISEYWENGNIPWFTVDDIRRDGRIINQTNQYITDKALKETSVKLLPENSVLLCCTASLGEVALTKIPLTTNQQFNGLVSKDKKNLFPFYLFYSTQKLGENLKSKSGKTTINFLSVGSLSKEKILLPPIKEQQKIAEILEAVDNDISKTQEIIKGTEKLKQGLMQQLFTRGIGHTKFKETKIGQIPELWSIVSVSEVVKKIVDNRGKTPPLASDGIGMIEVNAIDSSQKYPNYSRISKYVNQETYDTWFRSGHPEKGDILIPTVGTVGVAVIMNENKGCIAQNIIAVRVKDIILPDFFYYLAISPLFVDQIRKVLMGAVQPSLKVPHMLAFNIPLPTKPEQKEITEILSAVDEKISVNKKLKEEFIKLKKGLMSDLLSGKVRVNNK